MRALGLMLRIPWYELIEEACNLMILLLPVRRAIDLNSTLQPIPDVMFAPLDESNVAYTYYEYEDSWPGPAWRRR